MRPLTAAQTAYTAALADRDAGAATDVVTGLLAAGVAPVQILTDLVAVAQREVGGRWQRGEWSVAEEHAATAIAMAATKEVRAHVEQIPVTRGNVVVVCAEREWHELPAMIIDCALRVAGWRTSLLGASTSPLRLNQYLQDLGPVAVAVSCSVLGALPASRRLIEAGTASGVPVLVGGPAFGPDPRRARALGATAWAPDAHAAVLAMDTLPAVVRTAPPLPADVADEVAALELNHRSLVDQVGARWSVTAVDGPVPDLRAFGGDALRQLLHAVAAALLTGDCRPLPETVRWIADLLSARGVAGTAAEELNGLLRAALRNYPLSGALVAAHWLPSPR